jgi:glycosyltransferase involved in cell wall biosynthesis
MTAATSPAPSRVRIAFAVDNLQVGGTELNAVRLAERFDRSRFDLRLVSMQPDGPLAERYRRAGVPIDVFSPGTLFGAGALREGRRLRQHLKRQQIDIFHAHDLYSNLFGCPWARLAGTKVIASRRWADAPLPGRAWAIASRIPYHVAHLAIANSGRVARMLREYDRVPAGRIAVVPNFLDEEAFVPLAPERRRALVEELGLAFATVVIGIVANLRPVKDQATLLRAVARLRPRWPGIRLVLVGEGESREALERLAQELDLTRQIVLAGQRPAHPNLNHLFDISVLCSRKEGFPNSILEAMAAGKPVVATDVGGVGDAVVDGETGILVPCGDVERLAVALESLLADPARGRAMGASGRERARARHSPAAALAALESVYIRLAGRDATGHPLDRPRAVTSAAG